MTQKKNQFRQHIPGFVDGFNSFEFDFDTIEELLEHPWIKKWKNIENIGKPFHRFFISENLLICEMDGGKERWVLGYIKHPELIELPEEPTATPQGEVDEQTSRHTT